MSKKKLIILSLELSPEHLSGRVPSALYVISLEPSLFSTAQVHKNKVFESIKSGLMLSVDAYHGRKLFLLATSRRIVRPHEDKALLIPTGNQSSM